MSLLKKFIKYVLSSHSYPNSWLNCQLTNFDIFLQKAKAVWFSRELFLCPKFTLKFVHIALGCADGQAEIKVSGSGTIIRYNKIF